jgi:predicted RNA-binding Zn ribbon-like protein
MRFNSDGQRLAAATVALVNALTPGWDRGRPLEAPTGERLRLAVTGAMSEFGYSGTCTRAEAQRLGPWVERSRSCIERLADGDQSGAAKVVNLMLRDSQASPRLDPDEQGRYRVHFHGPDDTFDRGWAAGLAAGLAMALGGDLLHRFGVCDAPACDRLWVDFSKNAHRRFCSERCQSRVKAAAYRGRARSAKPAR